MGQVVDTETSQEFMKEILDKVDHQALADIAKRVEEKSEEFRERLAPEALAKIGPEDYLKVLGRIFSVKRYAKKLIEKHGIENLRAWTHELLWSDDHVKQRFQGFVDHLPDLGENSRNDFAGELLHFTTPDRHWLWTRWMWDPTTKTGALALVTTAAYDLGGESAGEIYMKVGRAMAFVNEVGDAAGFQAINKNVFGTDVFLSCVYVIYAYTVLKMRMTKEFNQVMPLLTEFSSRLLGVHTKKAPDTDTSGAE